MLICNLESSWRNSGHKHQPLSTCHSRGPGIRRSHSWPLGLPCTALWVARSPDTGSTDGCPPCHWLECCTLCRVFKNFSQYATKCKVYPRTPLQSPTGGAESPHEMGVSKAAADDTANVPGCGLGGRREYLLVRLIDPLPNENQGYSLKRRPVYCCFLSMMGKHGTRRKLKKKQ